VPPPAQGFAIVQSEQKIKVPFCGVPKFAKVVGASRSCGPINPLLFTTLGPPAGSVGAVPQLNPAVRTAVRPVYCGIVEQLLAPSGQV
jgi:hypothetical protein